MYTSLDEDEDADGLKQMHKDTGKFQLTVETSTRQCIYCTGPSGSGKSTLIPNYLTEWKKHVKKSDIYVFSALAEVEALDEMSGLKRIRTNDNLEE